MTRTVVQGGQVVLRSGVVPATLMSRASGSSGIVRLRSTVAPTSPSTRRASSSCRARSMPTPISSRTIPRSRNRTRRSIGGFRQWRPRGCRRWGDDRRRDAAGHPADAGRRVPSAVASELAGEEAIVDFALWGGVCAGQPATALDEQIAEGAVRLQGVHVRLRPDVPRHRRRTLAERSRSTAGNALPLRSPRRERRAPPVGSGAMQAAAAPIPSPTTISRRRSSRSKPSTGRSSSPSRPAAGSTSFT